MFPETNFDRARRSLAELERLLRARIGGGEDPIPALEHKVLHECLLALIVLDVYLTGDHNFAPADAEGEHRWMSLLARVARCRSADFYLSDGGYSRLMLVPSRMFGETETNIVCLSGVSTPKAKERWRALVSKPEGENLSPQRTETDQT